MRKRKLKRLLLREARARHRAELEVVDLRQQLESTLEMAYRSCLAHQETDELRLLFERAAFGQVVS